MLKAKAAITAITAVVLVGGATAAFAATPSGHNLVQNLTDHHPAAAATTTHKSDPDKKGDTQSQDHQDQAKSCPGLTEAQKLAAEFHLSTAANGNAVEAICALHMGKFKGTTTSGAAVSSSRVFGYGEIAQLLTTAQQMATKSSTKLSDANVSSALASVLHACTTSSSTKDCAKDDTMPDDHPGNGNGKPTVTPTPHH